MEDFVEKISDLTNRSVAQTKFLLELVGSPERLIRLEEKIRQNFIPYCPGDIQEVNKIMDLPNNWWWNKLGILYFSLGGIVVHKDYKRKGIVNKVMLDYNPPQLGIYWYGRGYYYWNDIENLILLMPVK